MTSAELIDKINTSIIYPLILLLFATGFMYFLWGMMVFVWKSDSDEGRSVGIKHMMWGIIGMFIMIAAWGIIRFIQNTLGI